MLKLSRPTIEEWGIFADRCRAPIVRDMLTFAEESIVLPDGPMKGMRFKRDRQPWAARWLTACSMPQWVRRALVGPTQSGKTLCGYVVPMVWHLFEYRETVVCGLPDMKIAKDKWSVDIKPVITAGPYKSDLPKTGTGSRDGEEIDSVKFQNNQTLKFMSGGGKDQNRSAYTTRVVLVTEADGLDEAGMASRESSKLKQIEGRTKAFDDQRLIYLECTASIQQGAIWQAWLKGTGSMLAVPCGSCHYHVIPERDSLIGWQDATSSVEARANAAWKCPQCAATWSDADRKEMNRKSVLVHGISRFWEKDDEDRPWRHVPALSTDDLVTYSSVDPNQNFFSMRYNAFNNLFASAAQLAEAEWLARRAVDADDADKQIRQQDWAMPAKNTTEKAVDLSIEHIIKRQHWLSRGIIPDGVSHITASMDVGKHRCHWQVVAWTNEFRGYVIDYGVKQVSQGIALEKAIEIAIREQWDEFQSGYCGEKNPELRPVDRMIVDSGYCPEAIYAVVRSFPRKVFAYKGYGESIDNKGGQYNEPKTVKGKDVIKGLQYHIAVISSESGPVPLIHANADYWKTFCHQRLVCGMEEPSAVTLYNTENSKHMELARHLTAEEHVTEVGPGGREIRRWDRIRRDNHWLDCYAMNCIAAHTNGSRLHAK